MAKVIGITLTGRSYQNGRYNAGFAQAKLDNGQTIFLGGEDIKGFSDALDTADKIGHDTTECRGKLEHWIETGEWK